MMTSRDEIWVNQGMETEINVLETMPSKLQLPNYLDKSSCHMVCTRKLYPVERRWLPDEIHSWFHCRNTSAPPPTSFLDFLTRLGLILKYYMILFLSTGFMLLPQSKLRLRLAGYIGFYMPDFVLSILTQFVAISLTAYMSFAILPFDSDVIGWTNVNVPLILGPACALLQMVLLLQDRSVSVLPMWELSSLKIAYLFSLAMILAIGSYSLCVTILNLWSNVENMIACSRTKPRFDLWNTVWFWT
jgi:hypothetical protein